MLRPVKLLSVTRVVSLSCRSLRRGRENIRVKRQDVGGVKRIGVTVMPGACGRDYLGCAEDCRWSGCCVARTHVWISLRKTLTELSSGILGGIYQKENWYASRGCPSYTVKCLAMQHYIEEIQRC